MPPATDMSTIREILKQSENIRQILYLRYIVMVMDLDLYAKPSKITWKVADHYANIILHLGTFHTIYNVMSILGIRFQEAGLRYLCIAAGIIAEGTVNRVIDGEMYN